VAKATPDQQRGFLLYLLSLSTTYGYNPEAVAQNIEFRLPKYDDWKLKLSECGGMLRGLGRAVRIGAQTERLGGDGRSAVATTPSWRTFSCAVEWAACSVKHSEYSMALFYRVVLMLFATFFVAPIASFFYFLIASIFFTSVLGIKSDAFDMVLYLTCGAAGFASAIYLVCRLWSKAERPRRPPDEW
jgi:hypothetical protein